MHLVFSDQSQIELPVFDSSLGSAYVKIYKHLATVDIPYKPWDNPYYYDNISYHDLIDCLAKFGQRVQVDVDIEICKSQDQQYFNTLHKIYETSYNGNPAWLEFHEHIHMCEQYFMPKRRVLCIDYREKSGLLERPMQPEWLQQTTTQLKAGDIFVSWSELGKPPYVYWKNKEPDDITRMCELAKPWLKLRPKINIALEDVDLLKHIQVTEFNSWWKQFEEPWARHWGLTSWTIDNMYGVSVFGHTHCTEELIAKLKTNQTPAKVIL